MDKPDLHPISPLPGAYWVVSGKLLAGAYPVSADSNHTLESLHALISAGISHVIDLTEVKETGRYYPPYGEDLLALAKKGKRPLSIDRMPIKDMWIPSRVEMCRILDKIDQTIHSGGAVFIHCIGGRGRTGTVVGCYLARHGVAADRELIECIEMLRSGLENQPLPSPETPQQLALVESWVLGE